MTAHQEWLEGFMRRGARDAIGCLARNVFPHDPSCERHRTSPHLRGPLTASQSELLDCVLRACHAADVWSSAERPAALERERDRTFQRSEAELLRSVRTIRASMRRHPVQWSRITSPRWRAEIIDIEADLKAGTGHRGALMYKQHHGCLMFPAAIKSHGRAAPAIETPLMFLLAFLFRRFSLSAREFAWYQLGETMPREGEPHHDVVAALVTVTHGARVTPDTVETRLKMLQRRHAGAVAVVDWEEAP